MEELNFYPDIEYNKQKRKHYYIFLLLAFIFVCGFGFAFIIMGGATLYMGIILIAVFMLLLLTLPKAMKNYPVLNDVVLAIGGDGIKINGVEVKYEDIKLVRVTCFVPSVGDANDNLAFFERCVKKPVDEDFTGSFDVYVLSKDGKKDVVHYCVAAKCNAALQAMVDFGFEKYTLAFSQNRNYKEAEYKLKKTEQ